MPSSNDNGRLVTILSIDGGGMRGVIPGYILAVLEEQLQSIDGDENARICDYFDYIAGTSTGGIVTALLTTPSPEDERRPCAASEINWFYRDEGPKIFAKAHTYKNRALGSVNESLDSYLGEGFLSSGFKYIAKKGVSLAVKMLNPTYSKTPRDSSVHDKLGDYPLAKTFTNVVIPTYDMNSVHPVIFSTHQAKMTNPDLKLADVIKGTTAAPIYFAPHRLDHYNLVDGGIAANNPTLYALHEATKMLCEEHHKEGGDYHPDYNKFLILSLGTGLAKLVSGGHSIETGALIEWFSLHGPAPPLFDALFRASDDNVEISTTLLLGHNNAKHNFLRIQDYKLKPERVKMDDASEDNISALEEIAEELLERPVTTCDKTTGLQREFTENDAYEDQSLLVDGMLPTNRKALEIFAKRLSDEKKRRERCGF